MRAKMLSKVWSLQTTPLSIEPYKDYHFTVLFCGGGAFFRVNIYIKYLIKSTLWLMTRLKEQK